MLVVEHEPHAGPLVNPQRVGGREADIVILQHQPALDVLGAFLPPLDPARAAGVVVVVDAADVRDHHRLVVQPHAVEHFRLARQVPDALLRQRCVWAVEQHVLRRVERQPDVEFARFLPERGQLGVALRHHVMELRHVGVRRVGRQVRRQPVHVELFLGEIVEDLRHLLQRAFQVRVLLPPPRVVALEAGLAHHLDGEAEAHWAGRVGHHNLLMLIEPANASPRPHVARFSDATASFPRASIGAQGLA